MNIKTVDLHNPSMRTAMVVAGGTGGHIFPGLALAGLMRERGWRVHWVGGAPPSMESEIVPKSGFDFSAVSFKGVRGKGLTALLELPFRLLQAGLQSIKLMRDIRPDLLIGLGGYITVPVCLVGALFGKPLVLHEQNSVAGSANKLLSIFAQKIFCAFPNVSFQWGPFKKDTCEWVGNPIREDFKNQSTPEERLMGRSGVLNILIVGGSLGAQALNTNVPAALALIEPSMRPRVVHQAGVKQIDALRKEYQNAGLQEGVGIQLLPFINDMVSALTQADLVICRAGASTVSELAALGVAAIYIPFPHAIDDHQTRNALFMVQGGGGWLLEQKDLTPHALAEMINRLTRCEILDKSKAAYSKRKIEAALQVVSACEEILI